MHEKIWMKRVLIPLWVIQFIVLLAFTAAAALALYAIDEVDLGNNIERVLNVGAAVQLAFSVFTIVLDIVEIILAASHRLGPVANIVIQSIKSAIWTFFFVIAIKGVVQSDESGLSVFLVLVLFLTCIAQLIYGAVIVHRHRKGTLYRGNYSLAAGGTAHGTAYAAPYQETAPNGSYPAYNAGATHPQDPFRNPSPASQYSAETAYRPVGSTHDYYGGNAPPNTYEMHGSAGRYQ